MPEKSAVENLQDQLKNARAPWYERIAIHNNAIGTITGFSIAVLGAFVAFANQHLTLIEVIFLTAATGALFELGHYWMRQVERDREIEWNIYSALYEQKFGDAEESKTYIRNAQRLRQENTDQGKRLNNLVRWSLGLTLFLLVLHGWLSLAIVKDLINSDMMIFILFSLLVGGLVLGILKSRYIIKIDRQQNFRPWELNVIETWNDVVSYLIGGFIAYYFFLYRWPQLTTGETLSWADFGLFVFFAIAIFGHLNVMSKNITEGIKAILARFLGEKL